MNDQIDPQAAKAINDVDAAGRQRFGEKHWANMIAALARKHPKGVTQELVREVFTADDPAARFSIKGREAMAELASSGDVEMERAHGSLREEERMAYRRSRGLVR